MVERETPFNKNTSHVIYTMHEPLQLLIMLGRDTVTQEVANGFQDDLRWRAHNLTSLWVYYGLVALEIPTNGYLQLESGLYTSNQKGTREELLETLKQKRYPIAHTSSTPVKHELSRLDRLYFQFGPQIK